MSNNLVEAAPKVVVEYKNKQPLDLLDLSASLTALGEQYKRFAARELGQNAGARLHVGVMRSGSVIAELVPLIQAANWALDHASSVAPFVGSYGDMLNLLRGMSPKARAIEKADLRGAKAFVAPVAKDPGSEVNIYATAGAQIITNIYNFGSNGSKDIRKHADVVLGGLPDEQDFEAVPMILYQMRDGPAGTSGDYGIIDRFTPAPVKIRWASEEVKATVLGRAENVFDLIYLVSGTAQTAGGNVAIYHVRRLDDVALKPAEERHA